MKNSPWSRFLFECVAITSLIGIATLLPESDSWAAEPTNIAQFRDSPVFGGATTKTTESIGYGDSENEAVTDALRNAVMQLTGTRISGDEGVRGAVKTYSVLAVEQVERIISGQRSSNTFESSSSDTVDAQSSGSVEFSRDRFLADEVIAVQAQETSSVQTRSDREENSTSVNQEMSYHWKATVQAEVHVYESLDDETRPKLVVAAPIVKVSSFVIGDERLASESIASEFQNKISEILSQTARFDVLGRDQSSAIQAEIDFINSSQSRNQDGMRLGQQFSADIILATELEQFEYNKYSRSMRTTGRELVSYSGSARVSMDIINPTTGVLVTSETFVVEMPAVAETTMATQINSQRITSEAISQLATNLSEHVIGRLFPISVISLSSNDVVLSQGGMSLEEGAEYEAVILGEQLIDPQTQRVLGRAETRCCIIKIEQVSELTSRGYILGEANPRLESFVPGMIELRGRVTVADQSPSSSREETPQPQAPSLPEPSIPEADRVDPDW